MTIDQEKRFRDIKRILLIILILNWGVALSKIFYGYATNFTSMVADGFHSLADGASNIIGLIGITLARSPPDKDHPYGHKKYETLFALAIAGMLSFVCFNIFSEGIKRLHSHAAPKVDVISMVVMLVTISINIFVMTYENRAGKRLNSDILISDSLHTRADIFTSASVIIAIAVIELGYPILDPIVTIMIAFFIAYAAFSIAKNSSKVLCDEIVILDDNRIMDVVMAVKGVKACHKIRTRGRTDDIHVDLHVQVDPGMHVDRAHDICFRIEDTIKSCISGVTDVVVHIEPKK